MLEMLQCHGWVRQYFHAGHLTKPRRCALAPMHRFSYLYRRKRGHPNLLITTHNSGITPQGVTVIKKSAARKCHARAEDAMVPG